MKLLPLLSVFALAGTLSLATAIPQPPDSPAALELDRRAPEARPEAAAAVEDEGRGGGKGGGRGDDGEDDDEDDDNDGRVRVRYKPGRPSRDFIPDGASLSRPFLCE
jgi:hypothetical protein